MPGPEKGKKAPDFCLPDQDEEKVCLKDLMGKWVVLYFYPKDNTSGCTLEAIDFTARKEAFAEVNTVVLGVSPDSIKSHCNFIDKHELTVRLLSDTDKSMMETFGVWGEKQMYGKTYMGVIRTTYLIDPEGIVREVWPKVKVKGHAEAVLESVKAHQAG